MIEFTKRDIGYIKSKGQTLEDIKDQIACFKKGVQYTHLDRPAVVGDGIEDVDPQTASELKDLFEEQSSHYKVIKFVPASGAASRMFKALFDFIRSENQDAVTPDGAVGRFISGLKKFAFFKDLEKAMKKDGLSINNEIRQGNFKSVIEYLVTEKGLNYGQLPKGLLIFHHYDDETRTAAEEHMVEAAHYSTDDHRISRIHFTVSPEHLDGFRELIAKTGEKYENLFNVKYDISYSLQKPSTDTISVDPENNPVRDEEGRLLFRPGGHGALLSNLQDLEADIAFIKNIDNVVPDILKKETMFYKKVIGGLLLEIRGKVFGYLTKLDNGDVHGELLDEMASFASEKIHLSLPDGFSRKSIDDRKRILHQLLNRPIRVCGMVLNEGEPGGGPFWVREPDGGLSLQIIESSQIDRKDPQQEEILQKSTHFNPVDLVCSMKDYKGRPFRLNEFVDPDSGFISVKSKNGKTVKALELPGLWNGAMAGWITLFVEVPVITFNPVKTVNDLLRKNHQP